MSHFTMSFVTAIIAESLVDLPSWPTVSGNLKYAISYPRLRPKTLNYLLAI